MSKGVSTIIAALLMLIITIALAGLAYGYISGVFTARTSTTFSIADTYNDTITITNDGTNSIATLTATVDGQPANIIVTPNVQGLVGYWSFNEGSGTIAADSSGNDNTGNLINTPSWVNGKFGKSLYFNGVNNYVNKNSGFTCPTSALTMAFWMKVSAQQSNFQHPLGIGGGHSETIYISPNSYYLNYKFNSIGGVSIEGYIATVDTNWHYITVTYDGSFVRGYVDGSLASSPRSASGAISCTDSSLFVGTTGSGSSPNGNWLNGIIDEVGIYNRALSDLEINQQYLGLVAPGQRATLKFLGTSAKGTHTARLCTPSMCQGVYLTIN